MVGGQRLEVFVDATNLHLGGGVQVAASIINEWAVLNEDSASKIDLQDLTIWVSTEVATNLNEIAERRFRRLEVVDSRPGRYRSPGRNRYDVALTIFGPTYRRRIATNEIMGFALPRLLIRPESVGLPRAGLREQIGNRIRWKAFVRSDQFVVETPAAAKILRERTGKPVTVIPNTVSAHIRPVADETHRASPGYRFASVGADYPHKNLDLLPGLAKAIEQATGTAVTFLVTLDPKHWSSRSTAFQQCTENWGVLRQSELPALYAQADAAILPSRLEVSSATPLESMALNLPVFVSDLEWAHNTYGTAVAYFNPSNAEMAARDIVPWLQPVRLADLRSAGRAYLAEVPTPNWRASAYLDLMHACTGERG